jgi:hypothetical protein
MAAAAAAAAAATLLSRIVQSQRINHLQSCMDKKRDFFLFF